MQKLSSKKLITRASCGILRFAAHPTSGRYSSMKKLLILLTVAFCVGCTEKTIESDSLWAKEYMQQFKESMHLEHIYKILKQKRNDVKFYNNCIEEFEYPMQACSKGYNLVITVKLPSNSNVLGKGDLQMYFTFNNQQQLTSKMHELYYPAHH